MATRGHDGDDGSSTWMVAKHADSATDGPVMVSAATGSMHM